MKKQLLFAVLTLLCSRGIAQSWHATNLTSVNYLPIVMETHQGKLYATVANGFTATFNKLNTDNTSWSAIATGSDITVPRFMCNAGSRLYLSSVNSGVFSMVYYTTDGGTTYVVDTAGLPHFSTGVALISRVQYHNGKVIVAMSGNGYYLKDTGTTAWHSINPPTAFNAPLDPLTYYKDTLYGYDNSGANVLYTSTDWGTTWTVRTTDLPTDFITHMLVADDVTGRLYAAGAWSTNTMYGLKYSDDGGRTWTTSTNAASFISQNYNHTQQQVTAIYAHSPYIYLALENDKNLSAPNIVGSVTGLSSLAYDTTGLPTNSPGSANGFNFLMYQGKLTMSLNVGDVYIKDGSNGVKEQTTGDNKFAIYPNPCKDKLMIAYAGSAAASEIRITDYTGRVVWSADGKVKEADLSTLRTGLYFIQFVTEGSIQEVKKFIKE